MSRFNAQREGRWIQNELSADPWPTTLYRSSMTILGLGTTGIEVARRAHAFGMRVTGVRRHVNQQRPEFVDRVLGPEALDEALRGCDALVVSAPALAETDRMIGANQIALLNRGAIIANVARGRIVDQSAMIAALESGHLGGARPGCVQPRTARARSPLWTVPNVIITPHSSGFRAGHWDDVIELFRRTCGDSVAMNRFSIWLTRAKDTESPYCVDDSRPAVFIDVTSSDPSGSGCGPRRASRSPSAPKRDHIL